MSRALKLAPAFFFVMAFASACKNADDSQPAATKNEQIVQGESNMPAGFQVINNVGGVQIDQDFYAMHFVRKGAVISGANGIATLTVAGTAPIVFVRTSDGIGGASASIASVSAGAGGGLAFNYTITAALYSAQSNRVEAVSNKSVDFFVFDRVLVDTEHYGLQVFKSDSSLAFSSNSGPLLKIHSVHDIPAQGISAPTNAAYALATVSVGVLPHDFSYSSSLGLYIWKLVRAVVYADSGNVSVTPAWGLTMSNTAPNPQPMAAYKSLPTQLMVADVSGL